MTRLQIAAEEASRFYRLLFGGDGVETEIRCIHPHKKTKTGKALVQNFWGSLERPEFCQPFVKLNEEGYGIYLVVNQPDPAEGRERVLGRGEGVLDSHIIRVNSLFVELDRDEEREGENLYALQEAALPPSMIMQSSLVAKQHGYWLVADCPPEKFKALQAQLIARFRGDPACKNLSRVMRLPGFYHTKAEPVRSRLIEDSGAVYTVAELCAAFDLDPDYRLYEEAPELGDWTPEPGIEGRILNAARHHAQRVKKAGVGRHNALFWLAMSAQENRLERGGAERLAEAFVKMLPKRGDEPVPLAEAVDVIDWVYRQVPAGAPWQAPPGAGGLPGQVIVGEAPGDPLSPQAAPVDVTIHNEGYAVRKLTRIGKDEYEESYQQLTNWLFIPTLALRYPSGGMGERGRLIVNGGRGFEIDLPAKAWNGRRDLLEQIGDYGAVLFTNSAGDVAKLRQFVSLYYPDLPSADGVRSYGLHRHGGEWVALYENETVSSRETDPIFYASTPVDPGSKAHAQPPPATPEQVDQARQAIRMLPGLVTASAALGILGYGMASAYSPRITPHLGHRLPLLFVAGEREGGKTSAAQSVLELATGYGVRINKASGMTDYQYDVAHANANNLLALLDEYRPGELDDAKLRKHHDLGVRWRGTGKAARDLPYILNAPMIVLGEGFTEDAAALSRGALYFIEKRHRGTVQAYGALQRLPLWAYARHLHELARTASDEQVSAWVARAAELAEQASGGKGGPRLQYALTYIGFGLLHLQRDVGGPLFTDEVIVRTLAWGVHHTLDGGQESMTNLEQFLEQLGAAASDHRDPLSILVPASGATEIVIRVSAAVEAVRRQYRERASITNARLLSRYAEQAAFASPRQTHKVALGSMGVVKGIKIDLLAVPERCDVSALEYLNDRLRRD